MVFQVDEGGLGVCSLRTISFNLSIKLENSVNNVFSINFFLIITFSIEIYYHDTQWISDCNQCKNQKQKKKQNKKKT